MIPFAVDWDKSAEMELADIWLSSPDPKAVTVAAARIDVLLALDPVKYGLALSEGLHKLAVPPLIVYFSISQIDRTVMVSDVFYRP